MQCMFLARQDQFHEKFLDKLSGLKLMGAHRHEHRGSKNRKEASGVMFDRSFRLVHQESSHCEAVFLQLQKSVLPFIWPLFFCPTVIPHHCSAAMPLCTNRSGKSGKKGYRFLEDGSVERYRLCGSDRELVRVDCGGNAAACSSLSFYTYPNPNVKDAGLSKRNKALLKQWQVKVRKENLVLSLRRTTLVWRALSWTVSSQRTGCAIGVCLEQAD